MEQIVSLCKRRGFVYPASEIYGGIRGFWDYGPLGVLLKNNIRDWWWRQHGRVARRSARTATPSTWSASTRPSSSTPRRGTRRGHVAGFNDPMVDDRETKARYRADHVKVLVPKDGQGNSYAFVDDREAAEKKIKRDAQRNAGRLRRGRRSRRCRSRRTRKIVGPDTKTPGTLTEPRAFNLMLDTYPGPIRDEENKAYLRPETAQGIFLNFKNVVDTTRVKVPFGIAQIGKSFRNEVTPRNFIFRSREFEQMEMEWFCHPDEARKWYEFWKARADEVVASRSA